MDRRKFARSGFHALFLLYIFCLVTASLARCGLAFNLSLPLIFPVEGFQLVPIKLLSNLVLLFLLVLFQLSALLWGKLVFSSWQKEPVTPFSTCSTYALGLLAISLLMFLLGSVGLIYTPLAWLIIVIPFAWELKKTGWIGWKKFIPGKLPGLSRLPRLAVLMLGLSLLSSLAPPIAWDPLADHLRNAYYFSNNHSLAYVEGNFTSNYPGGMTLLYTLCISLCGSLGNGQAAFIDGDILAKLFSWSFYPMLMFCLLSVPLSGVNDRSKRLAVAIFAVIPWFFYLACDAYYEPALAFFQFLALVHVLLYQEKRDSRSLVVAACLAGFSMAAKYPGLFGVIALIVLISVVGKKRSLSKLARFLLIAALPVLPWLARNYLQTGNPVFPLLYDIFGGRGYSGYDAVHQAVDSLRTGYAGIFEYLRYLFTRPFRVFTPREYPFDLYPLYVLFIPFVVIKRCAYKVIRPLVIYTLVFYVFWSLVTNEGRHLQVLAPVLSLLAALGYTSLKESGWLNRKVLKACLNALLVLAAGCSLLGQLSKARPYSAAFGLQSRGGLFRAHYLMDDYLWARQLTSKLPLGDDGREKKLIFAHHFFSYGFVQECYQDYFFAEPHLVKFLRQADTPEKLYELMREKEIGFLVYFPKAAFMMARKWRDLELSGEEIEVYRGFTRNYMTPIAGREDATIYEIKRLPAPRETDVLPGIMQILEAKRDKKL